MICCPIWQSHLLNRRREQEPPSGHKPSARKAERLLEVGMVSPVTAVSYGCDAKDYYFFFLEDEDGGEVATNNGEVANSIVSR